MGDFATGCSAPTTFVIADLHFGDGKACAGRPFLDAATMGREIVRRWNARVRPQDVIYVLGDIGKQGHVGAVAQLNGTKHLIAGNADDVGALATAKLFASTTVARWLPGFLLTHIPVHPSQLRGRTINVHGHLHSATVGDPRYRCVSADQTDFAPVPLADLSARSDQGRLL